MNYTDNSESLRENKDFQIVYNHGRSAANRALVLYIFRRADKMREWEIRNSKGAEGEESPEKKARMPHSWKMAGYEKNRVGISVSKKVGNSVVRHHLCRLVRESYRLHDHEFDRGLDMVVIVRPGARELSFSDIDRALLHTARKLKAVRKAETMNSVDA